MQTILLIGKNGQVGWELQRTCLPLGDVISLDYPDIDLGDAASVRKAVAEIKPSIILNAAAYTNVDKAESELELARRINATGPGVLAEEAKKHKAVLIHYSTDYVFDGTKKEPYVETDAVNPINAYGATKLEGEQLIQAAGGAYIIFRTSWVYSNRVGGFVNKVLQWSRQQEVLRVVDDQVSSPTWARYLAQATAQVLAQGRDDVFAYISEKTGLYHLAGGGSCSRYDWAKAILELDPNKEEQKVKELVRAKSSEFPTPASRPEMSVLESKEVVKGLGLMVTPWDEQLKLM